MNNKKLTLEELIAKAEQRKADKTEYRNVYVKELDGTLTLKKIPLARYVSLFDDRDANSASDSVDLQKDLIYASCPMLHDKALQDAYGCTEPSDIVFALLNDNLDAVRELSDAITEFYGDREKVQEALKN